MSEKDNELRSLRGIQAEYAQIKAKQLIEAMKG
jgi:hypothetical protein